MKNCSRCKRSLPLNEFYIRREVQTHAWCKRCVNEQTKTRQRKMKASAVEYKGGVCVDCGGTFHPCVYDFHHVDPSQKDFNLAKYKCLAEFSDKVKAELDKCVLLCSNCHRLRHVKY